MNSAACVLIRRLMLSRTSRPSDLVPCWLQRLYLLKFDSTWRCSLAFWFSMSGPASGAGPAYIGLLVLLNLGFSFSPSAHGTTVRSKVCCFNDQPFALCARQYTRVRSAAMYRSNLCSQPAGVLSPSRSDYCCLHLSRISPLLPSKLSRFVLPKPSLPSYSQHCPNSLRTLQTLSSYSPNSL